MELWQWAYLLRHAIYVVDQSQQTGPSDQSEKSRNLRTALNESFENRWKRGDIKCIF